MGMKGKKVIMNDKYYVSEKNKGKVFTVITEPYNVCGSDVVKLEGYSGCYAVDGLTVVENKNEHSWKDAMLSNFNRSK